MGSILRAVGPEKEEPASHDPSVTRRGGGPEVPQTWGVLMQSIDPRVHRGDWTAMGENGRKFSGGGLR